VQRALQLFEEGKSVPEAPQNDKKNEGKATASLIKCGEARPNVISSYIAQLYV
jgi:hypothetical protein